MTSVFGRRHYRQNFVPSETELLSIGSLFGTTPGYAFYLLYCLFKRPGNDFLCVVTGRGFQTA